MPLEPNVSGVTFYISAEEASAPDYVFTETLRIRLERLKKAVPKGRKNVPDRAVVVREGDDYRVTCYADKMHMLPGNTVPLTYAAIYAEIVKLGAM